MVENIKILSENQEDTEKIAAMIAPLFHAGDLLVLDGDLGAGKTHFVKGFAGSFGIEADAVTSPTFSIANFYRTSDFDLLHIDLYRLDSVEEWNDLGMTDYFDNAIVLVEWGLKFPDFFDEPTIVSFAIKDDTKRILTFFGKTEIIDSLKKQLKDKLC